MKAEDGEKKKKKPRQRRKRNAGVETPVPPPADPAAGVAAVTPVQAPTAAPTETPAGPHPPEPVDVDTAPPRPESFPVADMQRQLEEMRQQILADTQRQTNEALERQMQQMEQQRQQQLREQEQRHQLATSQAAEMRAQRAYADAREEAETALTGLRAEREAVLRRHDAAAEGDLMHVEVSVAAYTTLIQALQDDEVAARAAIQQAADSETLSLIAEQIRGRVKTHKAVCAKAVEESTPL